MIPGTGGSNHSRNPWVRQFPEWWVKRIRNIHLPKDSLLPALYRMPGVEKDGLSERDILYKVLFDMRTDVIDLKKIVLDFLNGQGGTAGELVKENASLFRGVVS